MKLTLDNLDGLGAVDYSGALDRAEPVEITRTLNAPSTARGLLTLLGTALKPPVRRARVVLAADSGALLFTGYLTTEPVPLYAGAATEGPVYRLAFRAVSDEWLLDKQTGTLAAALLGRPAGSAVAALSTRLAPGIFTTTGVLPGQKTGALTAAAGASFSEQAGALAGATYSSYRVLNGALELTEAGSKTHLFSDGAGTLALDSLRTASVKELSNDVTVSGAEEPCGYWQEHFLADGVTPGFTLTGEPGSLGHGHASLVADDFAAPTLNLERWNVLDPGSHLALTSAGFTMAGGNGFDGQTTLTAATDLELGGTVVVELAGVQLAPPSNGVLAGLYNGSIAQANCVAGFSVKQSGGNTVVTPMIAGAEVGTAYSLAAGQPYTLRLRLHCAELLRERQAFYAMVDVGGVPQLQLFGGGAVASPVQLTFEIRSLAVASNAVSTVLYDGVLASSPAAATLCVANSLELFGSVAAVSATRTGTALVQSVDPKTGTVSTRLAGKHLDGSECAVSAGTVTFFDGVIPPAGARVVVSYRGRRRAVARLADSASLAAEAAGNAPGTARWLGEVLSPPARSSEDCENAAQAILSFATDRAAALSGSYTAVNPGAGDLWPGDVLAFTAAGATTSVLARKVVLEERGAAPEVLTYRVSFANEWAEGLGLTLSERIAADAALPAAPLELAPGQTPASSGHVLPSLSALQVVAFIGSDSTAAITVDAGTDPPAGGGFEVRRRDGGFGTGAPGSHSGDLVLRSPVRGFQIPRVAVEEHFFVRMYDAAGHYSRFSAVVVTHIPLET